MIMCCAYQRWQCAAMYWLGIVLLMHAITTTTTQTSETEITQHVRRCCNAGLQYALQERHCHNAEHEVVTIPPLWRGLCLSAINVCCTRSIDGANCVAGRKAALIGASCNEPMAVGGSGGSGGGGGGGGGGGNATAAYGSCCRACQVGLAVKASAIDCDDMQFAYFKQIQSYRICCGNEPGGAGDGLDNESFDFDGVTMAAAAAHTPHALNSTGVRKHAAAAAAADDDDGDDDEVAAAAAAHDDDDDGTIVLNADDNDICGKVANLCEQICENTNEAYRCKCQPDYVLDDNNVTCTYVGISSSSSNSNNNNNNLTSTTTTTTAVTDATTAATSTTGRWSHTTRKTPFSAIGDADDIDADDGGGDIDSDTDDFDGDADGDADDDLDLIDDGDGDGVLLTPAGQRQRCAKGYQYDGLRHKCIDVDECQLGVATCEHNQYCHNIAGGYRCLSVRGKKSCASGYRYDMLNGGYCVDIDECVEQAQPCNATHERCYNFPGGYECQPHGKPQTPQQQTPSASRIGGGGGSSTPLHGYNLALGLLHNGGAGDGGGGGSGGSMQCGDGFQSKHGRCMDIDECVTQQHACDSSQLCTNDIGGYRCDCKIGFNLDATTNACIDINECSINNHNCLPTQRCDNTVGSYICTRLQSCGTGYTLNAETGNCDDDDECTLNTHNCPQAYECYNTKGSFRCYRRISTTTTTTTTTTTPKPTTSTTSTTTTTTTTTKRPAAAASSNSNSNIGRTYYEPTQYAAQQTHSGIGHSQPLYYNENSFMQKPLTSPSLPACAVGFQRNHLGACVDVNECAVAKPCGSHQQCINTNGSYRCQNLLQCMAGFKSTPDGSRCVDIDECETGEHKCVENQLCRNRNGGYVCTCPPGHQLTRIGNGYNRCMDVNECEQAGQSVCSSNAQCFNTIGSYYCECIAGYQKMPDNERFCMDVDECQQIPGLCQQKCNNYWGGYRCTCNQGYELNADNRTCNDVDECEVHKAYRPCMGFCINVPGSYECSCPRGYVLAMDQNTCRDIDECATGDFCTGRFDVCTNTRGGYKCTPIKCPNGYANDPDQKNRCLQKGNSCEGDDCYTKPSAYTYNFITLVSKLLIPPDGRIIFTMRGPAWYDYIDFNLKIISIQAAANIEKASDNHFEAIKRQHEVQVSLKRTLEGPQDIELELSMTVFTNHVPRGKSVAKIIIYVSQYTF